MHVPITIPLSHSSPEGISKDTVYFEYSLIMFIVSANMPSTSLVSPIPNIASITASLRSICAFNISKSTSLFFISL